MSFPDIDTNELFAKLKHVVSADLEKLFQKVVICKSPLENSDASRLEKYAKILISLQKEERDERLSLVDSVENPFNVDHLRQLTTHYSRDELLKLASSEEEDT